MSEREEDLLCESFSENSGAEGRVEMISSPVKPSKTWLKTFITENLCAALNLLQKHALLRGEWTAEV